MIKQRDYAGLMPNYQQLGAQQGQIWGGATQELFKALSQMLAQREADKYYGKFDVQSTTPQQNVTTDLLGRPITQTTSGYGGMPVTSQVPAGRRDVTTTQTVDYSQDPQRLIAGLMNANPEIARRAQAGIQGIQLQQPNLQNIPEGGTAVDYNRLSPTYGSAIQGQKRQERFSTGFGDFVKANASKYADAKDPLLAMYNDYQNQQVEQFGRKEETKAKYRQQRPTAPYSFTTKTGTDGSVLLIRQNKITGDIEEIPLNANLGEKVSAQTARANDKINAIESLNNQLEEFSKLLESVPTGRVSGIGTTAAQMAGLAPNATLIKSQKPLIAAVIQRTIGGQGSRLSDKDIKLAMDGIPDQFSTDAEIRGWFELMDRLIKSDIESFSNFGQFDLSGRGSAKPKQNTSGERPPLDNFRKK